jgi:hypothetical protein
MANTRITRRLVNSKRHTVGFVLTGGKQVTRSQAIQLASGGNIAGVRVVNGSQGRYLQSTGNTGLYELPIAQKKASSPSVSTASKATSKASPRKTSQKSK